ncbi:MAG: BrnT family toxin [Rhodoferax sp.]|nr:BrnT family toxin [Rhodoferax sp.]
MITWDEPKRKRNLKDHGIDLAEVACVFDAPMVTVEDAREYYGEQRLQSLGWFRNRVVFLVWTERNDSARVISCRYGDKHETHAYFEALNV